jgi:hypothetical protein
MFSSSLGLGLAQRTMACTTNIVNVAANTTGVSLSSNKTYVFAGGVNTLTATYGQLAKTWLCLISVNGARLRPPANGPLFNQAGNASLFLANLTIDGSTAASSGRGQGQSRQRGLLYMTHSQCISMTAACVHA